VPSKKSRPDRRRAAQPRLRVLAGPNGSGKSTIKGELKPEWIGVFVNADEIERGLKETGGALDLAAMGMTGDSSAVLARMEGHVRGSTFAQALGLPLVQLVDGDRMEIEAATLPRWFIETELWHSFNP
jgi:hypothetical protein